MVELNEFQQMLEPNIREIVIKLRENGFNTTCSCGDNLTVDVEVSDMETIDRLWKYLFNSGYKGFKIEATCRIPGDGFPIMRATINFKEWL